MKYGLIVVSFVFLLSGWAGTVALAYPIATEQGHYELEVEFAKNPVTVGMNDLMLKIHEQGSRKPGRESLKIEIVPWMPMHEHVTMEMPEITPMGEGNFQVKGLNFSMPGDWEVHIRMDSGGKEDSAVVDVKVGP